MANLVDVPSRVSIERARGVCDRPSIFARRAAPGWEWGRRGTEAGPWMYGGSEGRWLLRYSGLGNDMYVSREGGVWGDVVSGCIGYVCDAHARVSVLSEPKNLYKTSKTRVRQSKSLTVPLVSLIGAVWRRNTGF